MLNVILRVKKVKLYVMLLGQNHKNNKIYDNNREDYLKNNFNCHFVRIDEDEFLKNIDDGITNAINDISQIINSF